MNDKKYGFNNTDTLYDWILAMNGGSDSQIYQDIVDYFVNTVKLTDFNNTVMD